MKVFHYKAVWPGNRLHLSIEADTQVEANFEAKRAVEKALVETGSDSTDLVYFSLTGSNQA